VSGIFQHEIIRSRISASRSNLHPSRPLWGSRASAVCPAVVAGLVVVQQSFSKVTAVNDDSLFKKSWLPAGKAGTFASTVCTKRRGRDSFGTVLYGLGISAISDAMSMPVNDL
jgi:hypothetical protein